MNKIIERLKTNIKLTVEAIVVISAEIVKLISYWVLIKSDTIKIWKVFENKLKKFKNSLWK